MKIFSIFSLIAIAHFAVIGTLFVQPGCQSKPASSPDPTMTRMEKSGGKNDEAAASGSSIDPAFNAGMRTEGNSVTGSSQFSEPMRPVVDTAVTNEIDNTVLEPVLEPVSENIETGESSSYKVQRGDTLSRIAKRNGVPLNDLLAANNLSKSSTIYVGQSLVIPSSSVQVVDMSTPTPSASGEIYTVQRGDNLSKIASRYGVTVAMLKSVNGLRSDTIFVGQELKVPILSGSSSQVTTSLVPTPVTSSEVQYTGGSTYTVQRGDTPSGIAKRFGVSAKALMATNGITDPRKLFVGQELNVPSTSSGSRSASQAPIERSKPVSNSDQAIAISKPSETKSTTTASSTEEDPMALLEALEEDDLPFAEVEEVNPEEAPAN